MDTGMRHRLDTASLAQICLQLQESSSGPVWPTCLSQPIAAAALGAERWRDGSSPLGSCACTGSSPRTFSPSATFSLGGSRHQAVPFGDDFTPCFSYKL